MPGWSPEKAEVFREEFYRFLGRVRINSKEAGQIILGEHLYRAQQRFFNAVFTGLQEDVHDFKHTKSRQLGISTGSRMLTVFWAGVHDGLRGSMVFDTGPHAEEARLELLDALEPLPRLIKFPRIERENRNLIQLSNGTRINFAAAGIKETKSTGVLGRSTGLNFCHCSELCSWAGGEGLTAFMNALAQDFPDRLYIWESTGRGYNLWYKMWEEAKADNHMRTLFSGWWAKDNQILRRDDPDWERYASQPPTSREIKRMREVQERYDWKITPEQLAWVRRNSNPNPEDAGDAPVEFEATTDQLAEQAWVEEDCFQLPGSNFFPPEALQKQATINVKHKFQTWAFFHGVEFPDLRVERARNSRAIELKVWEEPVNESVYVVAADPAFGYNEKNDRSAIQVGRCYADGVEQVAEYAWPLIATDQFAHVILAIAAWYAGDTSEVYLIVELNGPGDAVWKEIRETMKRVRAPHYAARMAEKGLPDVFRNVRHYIYSRADSMGGGRAWQFKSGPQIKETMMMQLQAATGNGTLIVRSMAALEEMKTVQRDGASIEATGEAKDDRVASLGMMVVCWFERVRAKLASAKRDRDFEHAKHNLSVVDRTRMFNRYQLDQMFALKAAQRKMAILPARRGWGAVRRNFGRRV